MSTRRGRTRERGQVLVIVAGGFLGLVAIVGLVLDGGVAFLNRRDGQNVADLSAMAGARMIAKHYTDGGRTGADVFGEIQNTININNCDPAGGTPCDWTASYVGALSADLGAVANGGSIPGGALGVRVNVHREPRTYLSQFFNIRHWNVDTEAVATATKGTSFPSGVMLPIAVCGWESSAAPNDCAQASNNPSPGNFIDFQIDQVYDLTDGKDAPGGFGWLSWNGSNSAAIMADRVCNPSNPAFTIDSPYDAIGGPGVMGTNPADGETWFPIDPGKSNAAGVRTCLQQWIDTKTPVLVPIYDIVQGNGNNAWYHITGVAQFVLISKEQPAVDNIRGIFKGFYDLGGGGTELPPGPEDTTVNVTLKR
jgi:Putative Flp pilus-assembly TadE/G-like